MKTKIHYGWFICIACAMLIYVTSGTAVNGFPVFMPYIMDEFGITATENASIISVRWGASLLALLFIRKYYDKFGMKLGMVIAAICAFIGDIVFIFANSFFTFSIGSFFCGLSYGLGSMVAAPLFLSSWFLKDKQLANSIAIIGVGIAILTLPPILTSWLEKFGIAKAFIFQGIMIAVLIILFILIAKNSPEEMGLKPYGYGEEEETKVQTAKRPFSKVEWILVCAAACLIGIAGGAGYSNITVHLDSAGYDSKSIAILLSVLGFTLIFGRILCGRTADKLGGLKATTYIGGMQMIGHLMMCFAFLHNAFLTWGSIVMLGLGFSMSALSSAVWASDLASIEEYSKVMQRTQIAFTAGCMAFSSIPGVIADNFNNSYVPSYIIFTAFMAIVIVTIFILYRMREND